MVLILDGPDELAEDAFSFEQIAVGSVLALGTDEQGSSAACDLALFVAFRDVEY